MYEGENYSKQITVLNAIFKTARGSQYYIKSNEQKRRKKLKTNNKIKPFHINRQMFTIHFSFSFIANETHVLLTERKSKTLLLFHLFILYLNWFESSRFQIKTCYKRLKMVKNYNFQLVENIIIKFRKWHIDHTALNTRAHQKQMTKINCEYYKFTSVCDMYQTYKERIEWLHRPIVIKK